MSTLYIDRRHAEMRCQSKALTLRIEGERNQSIPLHLIERIVVTGKVQTDTSTLAQLAAEGITVHFLSGRKGERMGTLLGPLHNDVRRRLAQYRAHQDRAACATGIARYLLSHKIRGQRRLLRRALRRRPELRRPLALALERLDALQRRVDTEAVNIPTLRGIEGAAAAHYFDAYVQLFPASLAFEGRRRRPPPDPVNACLSLAYTLIHGDALQAIHCAGLDPFLGYLHEPNYGRPSLASDLIEPLRPRIDAWIWGLFRERTLRESHFVHQNDGACFLNKNGRALFYPGYEKQARPWRRWLKRTVYRLIDTLQKETAGGEWE